MGSSMPMNSTGNNDANFYIVKLLDKEKPVKDKLLIEALPNPTVEYTAIVIGYEYEKGTCTLVDLGGRVLQSFAIEANRTIPIQLKSYPDGVYIINIKTDKGDDGIKVLKTSY
jgi:non-homologous end joining protein Ku